MSAVMLLNHLAQRDGDPAYAGVAQRIREAYDTTLRDGARTRDVGGELGTREFADSIVERLKAA